MSEPDENTEPTAAADTATADTTDAPEDPAATTSGSGPVSQPNDNQGDPSAIKDPSDWVTGGEPATGAQKSYLATLATEAGADVPAEPSKAEASQLIDELQDQSRRIAKG